MSEIKRTREEAIAMVTHQVDLQQKNNGLCGQLEYTDRSVFARCWKGGEFFNVVEEFTSPAPEFEKGTVGVGCNGELCFYKKKLDGGDHLVTHHRGRIYEDDCLVQGFRSDSFTPIYQNDPILERAYDNFALHYCKTAVRATCDNCPNIADCITCDDEAFKYKNSQAIKTHFLSQAKEELSDGK